VFQHRAKERSLSGYSNMSLLGNTQASQHCLPLLAVGKGCIAYRDKLGKWPLREFLGNHVLERLTTQNIVCPATA